MKALINTISVALEQSEIYWNEGREKSFIVGYLQGALKTVKNELEAMEEPQSSEWSESTLWARKCDVTGLGMNQGWCFRGGERYAATQEAADQIATEYGYKDFQDMYEHENHDEEGGDTYWTEWEEDDAQWVEVNGQLTEIE